MSRFSYPLRISYGDVRDVESWSLVSCGYCGYQSLHVQAHEKSRLERRTSSRSESTSLILHQFAHASESHLIENMLTLLAVSVEASRALGCDQILFALLYLCSGWCGGLCAVIMGVTNSRHIGASGSIIRRDFGAQRAPSPSGGAYTWGCKGGAAMALAPRHVGSRSIV